MLAAALPNVRPAESLQELRSDVNVNSVTGNIISVSAKAKVAADAEATANAVADSYIKYVDAPSSPIGHRSATHLQRGHQRVGDGAAGSADRDRIPRRPGRCADRGHRVAGDQPPGQAARARDEIANSVGFPVLASFPVAQPSDAAGWTRLLQEYKPAAVHAWRLRTALRRVGVPDRRA